MTGRAFTVDDDFVRDVLAAPLPWHAGLPGDDLHGFRPGKGPESARAHYYSGSCAWCRTDQFAAVRAIVERVVEVARARLAEQITEPAATVAPPAAEWTHRAGRDYYDVLRVRNGRVAIAAVVLLNGDMVERPAVLIRSITEVMADHHGGRVAEGLV